MEERQDIWGVADLPQLVDLGLFADFLSADPAKDAWLRNRACAGCAEFADRPEKVRLARCLALGCGLRDQRRIDEERAWAASSFLSIWRRGPQQEEAVLRFNEHIAAAGVATAGLQLAEDGTLRRYFHSWTLRGRLHRALVAVIAAMGGDPGDAPAQRHRSTEETRAAARRKRKADGEVQGVLAALLERQGVSLSEIAEQFGADRATIRKRIDAYYKRARSPHTRGKAAAFRY